MSQIQEFTWEIFISMVNYMSYKETGRQLTRLEKELLRCFWNDMTLEDILTVLNEKRLELDHYYNNTFFSNGFVPNLMNRLSQFISEPVNKNNFKEVYKRIWERAI